MRSTAAQRAEPAEQGARAHIEDDVDPLSVWIMFRSGVGLGPTWADPGLIPGYSGLTPGSVRGRSIADPGSKSAGPFLGCCFASPEHLGTGNIQDVWDATFGELSVTSRAEMRHDA